jgi:putative thioredoxin
MGYIDVSEATFEKEVLQKSFEAPVVVDFWAAWCGPCRALSPVLEKLAAEANGDWVLAKIDVDANQMLAATFGVQGIPAVKAFKDGRQVAEFVGALPEDHVRQWLKQLGPSPADSAFEHGAAREEDGDLQGAARQYRRALAEDPSHERAKSALARVELALRSGDLDEEELRARVAREPADSDAELALADLDAARGDLESAFRRLLELVRATAGDERERARSRLVELLETIPAEDPRAVEARRALAAALF